MKKLTVFLVLLATILFCGYVPSNVYASQEVVASNKLGVSSKECVLLDYNSKSVIFEKNCDEKRPVASVTKLMTLILAYEAINDGKCSLDDMVTVSERASGMGGSQAFLSTNSQHSLDSLLKTIIICSANDSCVAVAEHIYGSVENFVDKMNEKAVELGLKNTNFVNTTGLPALNQYSCARDCATMLCHLIDLGDNYFTHSKIWMEDYKHPDGRITGLTNTNKLIRFYNGCDGGKTGYTNEAMHCLCATAKRGEMRLICCVLAEPDSKTRFAEVSQMFNYGFSNYESKVLLDENTLEDVEVSNGKQTTLKVIPTKTLSAFGKKGEIKAELVVEMSPVKAPVNKGDVVGKAYLVKEGVVVDSTEIVASTDVKRKTYFDNLIDISNEW